MHSPELKDNHLFEEKVGQFAKDTLVGKEEEITLFTKDDPTDNYDCLLVYLHVSEKFYQEMIGLAKVA